MVNRVKELNTFYFTKLQSLRNKMKTITNGIPSFIPKIIDDENKIKEWQEWSDSFDNISKDERFVVYSNRKIGIVTNFYIVDVLYKLKVDMDKKIEKVRALTGAK